MRGIFAQEPQAVFDALSPRTHAPTRTHAQPTVSPCIISPLNLTCVFVTQARAQKSRTRERARPSPHTRVPNGTFWFGSNCTKKCHISSWRRASKLNKSDGRLSRVSDERAHVRSHGWRHICMWISLFFRSSLNTFPLV